MLLEDQNHRTNMYHVKILSLVNAAPFLCGAFVALFLSDFFVNKVALGRRYAIIIGGVFSLVSVLGQSLKQIRLVKSAPLTRCISTNLCKDMVSHSDRMFLVASNNLSVSRGSFLFCRLLLGVGQVSRCSIDYLHADYVQEWEQRQPLVSTAIWYHFYRSWEHQSQDLIVDNLTDELSSCKNGIVTMPFSAYLYFGDRAERYQR